MRAKPIITVFFASLGAAFTLFLWASSDRNPLAGYSMAAVLIVLLVLMVRALLADEAEYRASRGHGSLAERANRKGGAMPSGSLQKPKKKRPAHDKRHA